MKFYTLSPQGVPENPHLFPMMRQTLIDKGHSFVNRVKDCDVVLFDLHSRLMDYKQSDIDYILLNEKKVVTFCEWDRGGMSSDKWPMPLINQQIRIMQRYLIDGVHFCRLLDKNQVYPPNLFPYEKPIFYEEPLLTPDELFNREYDIVYIANYSPSRQEIAEAIHNDYRFKAFMSIGAKKRDFNDFVNLHKRGKLFISSGAGGYSDERKQNLFSIAALIQEETDQLLLHPFTHLENCIKISTPPTKEELDTIYEICNDKERLYEIYKNNYNFMRTHYSKEYIAQDIIDKVKKHLA